MARARSEGSVYRNAERGNWIAQVHVNGRKVKRTARSERDAVRLLAELRRQRDKGIDPRRVTVAAFLTDFTRSRQVGRRAPP